MAWGTTQVNVEIRATGASTNGAYFDAGIASAGTDYSLSDTPINSHSDGDCNNSTTFVGSGFTSAMIGNGVYLGPIAGITTGVYVVTTFTSSTQITLDRNPTSAGGHITSIPYSVGGANTTPEVFAASSRAGNTFNIQKGTYSWGTFTLTAGTQAAPLSFLGFKTNHNDDPTGTDRPSITLSGEIATSDNSIIKNLIVIGTYAGSLLHGGVRTRYENCKGTITNGAAVACFNPGSSSQIVRCEGSCPSAGNVFVGSYSFILGCNAHDSVTGFNVQIANTTIMNCIADTCTTGFISNQTSTKIIGCTVYGCTTGIDYSNAAATQPTVINCILSTNTTAIAGSATNLGTHVNEWNIYNGNGTDVTSFTKQQGCITANPNMVDPANQNFTVGASSNAVNAAAQNGTNTGAVGSYSTNIGVAQTAVPAAVTTAFVY